MNVISRTIVTNFANKSRFHRQIFIPLIQHNKNGNFKNSRKFGVFTGFAALSYALYKGFLSDNVPLLSLPSVSAATSVSPGSRRAQVRIQRNFLKKEN